MSEPKIEIYTDVDGKWNWKLKTNNNETVLSSIQGYKTKDECLKRLYALPIFLSMATTSIAKDTQKSEVIGYTKQVFFPIVLKIKNWSV